MFISSLSLIGFPFFTRLYFLNVILKVVYTKYTINGKFFFGWEMFMSSFRLIIIFIYFLKTF